MWSAFLYSSNSDTWSHLIVPEHVIEQAKLKQILSYCPTTTIVKDCPYWTSYNPSGHRLNFLKFDTRTNKFEFLPEFQSKSGRDTILVNMMDRPALMDYEQNFQNISVDVCSLDEDSGVWRKMYSVGPIANCGLKWDLTQGFKYGGSIVFYSDGVFSYYDHKTDTMCLVPGEASIVKDCPYWTLYRRPCSDEFAALNALKFETGSHEFKLLPDFRCKSGENVILVDMMDRPTLMDYEQDSRNISVDVYSLDEENGVWSKIYSVGPIANYDLKRNLSQGFKYGGEIVFHVRGILTMITKQIESVLLYREKVLSKQQAATDTRLVWFFLKG
ncbi:hypothetical protein ACET3Z_006310 [Daucus carota]